MKKFVLFVGLILFHIPICIQATDKVFMWGISEYAYKISGHLEERVAFSLLLENVKHSMETRLNELGVEFYIFQEANILPCMFSIYIQMPENENSHFLNCMTETSVSTFLRDFDEVKNSWLLTHTKKIRENQDEQLLKKIVKISSGMERDCLYEMFTKSKDLASDPVYKIRSKFMNITLPIESKQDPFDRLLIDRMDEALVVNFINELLNMGVLDMITHRSSLESIKNQLKIIHPLRLMAYIYSNDSLRDCVRKLSGFTIKKHFLMGGMERALRSKQESDAINVYIPGFARSLNVDEEKLWYYVNNRNIGGLVSFVFNQVL